MKIILVAFACHPEWGSESAAGWKMAMALAQEHQVHVITHPENRASIERVSRDWGIRQNLTFSFSGLPFKNHPNRMVARIMSWVLYKKWLKEAQMVMPQIIREQKPDLIHHATFATWRIGIPWHGFGLPVIWGPLGGAASFPAQFLPGLSLPGGAFELFRNLGTWVGCRTPAVIRCCRKSQAIICGNGPDAALIQKIRGRAAGVHVLSSAHFSASDIERLQKAAQKKDFQEPLQAFAGGICIGSKGISFALKAVALARQEGARIHYTVASTGPELSHLQKIVTQLDLGDRVRFHPGFRGSDYIDMLGASHLFLLPSFREGSPRTILEAMLAGAVPVVCDASAQGEIVGEKEGFAIPIQSREGLIRGLADALVRLDRDRSLLGSMSQAAQQKARDHFNSDHFLRQMGKIYEEALQNREAPF